MTRVDSKVALKMICLVGLALPGAIPLAAQTPPQCTSVDSSLSLPVSGSSVSALTACIQIQGYLSTFATTLSQWNGFKPSGVAFSSELLNANCNLGPATLTAPDHFAQVMLELNGLAAVGVTAITTCANFPLLYQPFYSNSNYTGSPQDFDAVVTFYKNLVVEAHRRGLKVIIETSVLFPGFSDQWNLPGYYATFYASGGGGDTAITAGRQQNALVIAQQIKPDYLNLGSEPDSQAGLLKRPGGEYTAQEYGTQISTIVTALRNAGITPQTGPLIGAGCGAWQQSGSDYVSALVGAGIDYYDMHIYSVNNGYLNDGLQYLDQAIAAGKRAAISEAWLHKMTDSQVQGKTELQVDQLLSVTSPLNPFTIWEPIDAEFMQELVDLAYWKDLLYISPFDSELFFNNTYVTFSPTASSSQVSQQVNKAEALAFKQGGLSTVGQAYTTAITPVGFPVLASSATGLTVMATDSIVSIYGLNLAATAQSASSLPLPTTLANVTVTATDNAGNMVLLPLIYVGPTQINAVIPSGLNTGLSALTITTPSGPVTTSAVLNSTAPGLFSANENAKGVAAAQVVINQTGGGQTTMNIFQCTAAAGCTPTPIDLSQGSAALVLYGTGIRNAAALSDVTVNIGSLSLAPFFAGAAPNYVGLDQVNVLLPGSLAGSGTVDLSVTVSGTTSNVVQVAFK
jgi:uncharacterized protein (TIGR03437 family)